MKSSKITKPATAISPTAGKEEIRAHIRALRSAEIGRFAHALRLGELGGLVASAVMALEECKSAKSVGLYAAKEDELPTTKLIAKSISAGKKVYLPRVRDLGLEWRRIGSEGDLKPGAFGLLEPREELPPADISSIDMIVVPGIAFDREGYRIGWGEGYYDRALEGYMGKTVGVILPCQLVEKIPADTWDKPVGTVVIVED